MAIRERAVNQFRWFVPFVSLIVVACVATWPLCFRLRTRIPTGSEPATVALFGLFTMEWTAKAIDEGRPYWDASMFYPHGGTLAWSEPQPFTAGVVWFISKAVGMIAAYNLVLLSYLVGMGLATYFLARQLSDDRIACLWAGTWITGGAIAIQQLGVLHLLAGMFPISCIAFTLSMAQQKRNDRAAPVRKRSAPLRSRLGNRFTFDRLSNGALRPWLAGAAFALTWLTCAQYGLFLVVLLPVIFLVLLGFRAVRWRQVLYWVISMSIATVAVLPFLLAQRARLAEMGFDRSLINVTGVFQPFDLVTPAEGHWFTSHILGWTANQGYYSWDLGLTALAYLIAAVTVRATRHVKSLAGLNDGAPPSHARTEANRFLTGAALKDLNVAVVCALLGMVCIALLLGFGPRLGGTLGPYAWLHRWFPGWDGLRSPARLGLFATVSVAALGAAALASLTRRCGSPGKKIMLTCLAFVLLGAEMWAVPIRLADPGKEFVGHDAVIRWLSEQTDGALLELPMARSDDTADLSCEVDAMRRALLHRHPVVNGYSGYFPEPYRQIRQASWEDPTGRLLRYAEALGARYLWFHHHDEMEGSRLRPSTFSDLPIVLQTDDEVVVELPSTAPVDDRLLAFKTALPMVPRPGDIIRLPVSGLDHNARLIRAVDCGDLVIRWTDGGGRQSARVDVRGSVLLDAEQPFLSLELVGLVSGPRRWEGRLISSERIGPLIADIPGDAAQVARRVRSAIPTCFVSRRD